MAAEATGVAASSAIPARRSRRLLPQSVRARATVAAVLIVGLALVVCAVSLPMLVRRSLVRSVDEAAEVLADDVAARAGIGSLPPVLSMGEGKENSDLVIQVVDSRSRVVVASENFTGQPPLTFRRPRGDDRLRTIVRGLAVDREEEFRVIAQRAESPTGPVTVLVATELQRVRDALEVVRAALTVGVPALLVLTGVLVWVLVGRALRPVESIRRQVSEISETALDRRVPEPPVDDEVGRLARTMNAMLDRLQSSAERQRRFVSDASHELRSPLASARAQLEVAAAHPETLPWEATAAGLLAENERMERLVTDLLFLARSDEGRTEAPRAAVDLDDLVLAETGRLRERNHVRVDISHVSAARVFGNREHLGRVVCNLLENAERHARSTVAVELAATGSEVELVVADDGPGVPPEDRERVFDRFVRLDGDRSRGHGGTGLGLAIAREIVRAHGGRIWVEGTTGARFVVRLPAGSAT
jgi:signal transduction histidine kinase